MVVGFEVANDPVAVDDRLRAGICRGFVVDDKGREEDVSRLTTRGNGGTVMAEQLAAVNEPPSQNPSRIVGSASRLVATTALTLLATAVTLAGVIVLANRPQWWHGLLGAAVVSVLAAGLSLLPLIWGMRHGMYQRVVAWFVAAGLRALVSLGGCVLAVRMGGYPAAPTMLMMVFFYFGLLAAESVCIARALWDTKDQA